MWRKTYGCPKFVTTDLALLQLGSLLCLTIQLIQQLTICLGRPGPSQASQAFLSCDGDADQVSHWLLCGFQPHHLQEDGDLGWGGGSGV